MVVQPQTGIVMPESNGDTMEEVPGAVGRARRDSFLPDSLTKDVWIVKMCPLQDHASKVSATMGMKSILTEQQVERWEDSLSLTPTWRQ